MLFLLRDIAAFNLIVFAFFFSQMLQNLDCFQLNRFLNTFILWEEIMKYGYFDDKNKEYVITTHYHGLII